MVKHTQIAAFGFKTPSCNKQLLVSITFLNILTLLNKTVLYNCTISVVIPVLVQYLISLRLMKVKNFQITYLLQLPSKILIFFCLLSSPSLQSYCLQSLVNQGFCKFCFSYQLNSNLVFGFLLHEQSKY